MLRTMDPPRATSAALSPDGARLRAGPESTRSPTTISSVGQTTCCTAQSCAPASSAAPVAVTTNGPIARARWATAAASPSPITASDHHCAVTARPASRTRRPVPGG